MGMLIAQILGHTLLIRIQTGFQTPAFSNPVSP